MGGVYTKGGVRLVRLGGGVYAKNIVYPLRRGIGVSRVTGVSGVRVVPHRLQVFGFFPLGVKVYRIARCPVGYGHAVYLVPFACAVRFCVPARKNVAAALEHTVAQDNILAGAVAHGLYRVLKGIVYILQQGVGVKTKGIVHIIQQGVGVKVKRKLLCRIKVCVVAQGQGFLRRGKARAGHGGGRAGF